ncbi:MAG: tetratricopeptide repeat protein [Flavobacteriales bacterium]|nr:tetratricopeptide repeat protein [Flavobacteriales bacterium]
MAKKTGILLAMLLMSYFSFSESKEDSLLAVVNAQVEVEKIPTFILLFKAVYRSDVSKSAEYLAKAKAIEEQNTDSVLKAKILYNLGLLEAHSSNYDEAIKTFRQAKEIATITGDSVILADILNNIGIIFDDKAEYPEALKYYNEAYVISKKIDYTGGYVAVTTNIGTIYAKQGEMKQALVFFKEALIIHKSLNRYGGIGNSLNNIGLVFHYSGQPDSALVYLIKARAVWEKHKDQKGMAMTYNNLGSLYIKKGETEKAKMFLKKSLVICYSTDDNFGVTQNLNQLSSLYISIGERDSAIYITKMVVDSAKKYSLKLNLKIAYEKLAVLYEEDENYPDALSYFKLYTATKDSIFNESKSKEIGKLEANYEFEKQLEEERRLVESKKTKLENEKSRRDNLQYSGIFVFVLILFAFVFMSGKFSMRPKLAEGLIFFTFLLVFEFCLVLLDPFIENWSSGEPLYKLLFNAILAALIFPLHAFFESSLKKKLVK